MILHVLKKSIDLINLFELFHLSSENEIEIIISLRQRQNACDFANNILRFVFGGRKKNQSPLVIYWLKCHLDKWKIHYIHMQCIEKWLKSLFRRVDNYVIKVYEKCQPMILLNCQISRSLFLQISLTVIIVSHNGLALDRYNMSSLEQVPICLLDPDWKFQHIETWRKWLTFCRWHFQTHFAEWKVSSFVSSFIVGSWGSN